MSDIGNTNKVSSKFVSRALPESAHCLAAFILGGILACIPLIVNANFSSYYIDDMQAQYMSTFYAIGKTAFSYFNIPLVTTHSWYGGNISGEYQYAVFNPVCVLLFGISALFGDLQTGATFLGIMFTAILAGGGFFLGRAFGIPRPLSYVASITISTNSYIFFWFASSWFPGLMSTSFALWAMGFILLAREGRAYFIGAVIFTALTATAGWPLSIIVLGVFVAITLLVDAYEKAWDRLWAPAAASALGIVIAAPALAAMIGMGPVSTRFSGIANKNLLVPNLGDLLSVMDPFYQGWMLSFGGYGPLVNSSFYAAWFIVPFMCMIDWRSVDWTDRTLKILFSLTITMLALTQGPEYLGPTRWPFRYIPIFQISMVLTTLFLVNKAGFITPTRKRIFILFLVISLVSLRSTQSNPDNIIHHFIVFLSILISALIIFFFRRNLSVVLAVIIVSVIGFVVAGRVAINTNVNLPDWYFSAKGVSNINLSSLPHSYEMYVGSVGDRNDPHRFDEILFGQMGLALGRSMINGYTPIGHRAFADKLCLATHGFTCPEGGARLLDIEHSTGRTFAELMRVNKIIAERGPAAEQLAGRASSPWALLEENPRTVVYAQNLPNRNLPGSLSWPMDGISVEAVGAPSAENERINVLQRQTSVNTLVFARLWWPGYRARFNGQEVPVRALDGFLVAVDLPPDGSTGILELSFSPPFFNLSLLAALAAAAIAIGLAIIHGKISSAFTRWERPAY